MVLSSSSAAGRRATSPQDRFRSAGRAAALGVGACCLAGAAAHRTVAFAASPGPGPLRLLPGQAIDSAAGVVQPQHERAQRGIANDAERAWIDLDPLQHVE